MRVETVNVPLAGSDATYTAYLADSRRKRPAVVICPGGGFAMLAPLEAEPMALFFLDHGYQAFVLNYTVGARPGGALLPAARELAWTVADIRRKSRAYGVAPARVAVEGSSAGGAVAATLATRWHEGDLSRAVGCKPEDIRPDAAVLSYPVTDFSGRMERALCELRAEEAAAGKAPEGVGSASERHAGPAVAAAPSSARERLDFVLQATEVTLGAGAALEDLARESPVGHVTPSCPPTFVWGTSDDEMVWAGQFLTFAQRLVEQGVPCELHLYEHGRHALSLGNENTVGAATRDEAAAVASWSGHAVEFLARHLG